MTAKNIVGAIAFVQVSGMMVSKDRPAPPVEFSTFSEAEVANDEDLQWVVQTVMDHEGAGPLVQRQELHVLEADDEIVVRVTGANALVPSWSKVAHDLITVTSRDGDAWGLLVRLD